MATSGTQGQTLFPLDEIITRAARRAGIMAAKLTPENIQILLGALQLMLVDWSNKGMKSWCINRTLLGVYPGQREVPLPVGSIDILESLWRTPQPLTAASVASSAGGIVGNLYDEDIETLFTQVAPNGNLVYDWGTPVPLNMLGLLPSGNWTSTLVLEQALSAAGPWSIVKTFGAMDMIDGVWQWYQLEPTPIQQYVRLRETGGATMAFREIYTCYQYNDITISRVNRDDDATMPFKNFPTEQPTQYWLDRQIIPKMVLWGTPNNTFFQVYAYIHRSIEDVGDDLRNEIEVPMRYQPPITWGLAKQAMLELPDLIDPGVYTVRWPIVSSMADSAFLDAQAEDRDNTPANILPDLSCYTR